MKKWNVHRPDAKIVAELRENSDLSELCCRVLAAQGYIHVKQAAEVLQCQGLSDPFLICDMEQAAKILNAAIASGKKICVYGDYDCDGVIATVILYSFLSEMGADVIWKIPERQEGYGLNMQAVQEMQEAGVQLIVTVDNGISALKEAKRIQELGMELLITDHHQPGEELPEAVAIVDAHRMDNASPYRLYCGAGIALLLVAAMNDGDLQMAMEQFGDLAAIATIADVVSLTGENRFLVNLGIQYLENTERAGLIALRNVSGLAEKPLDAINIAFTIAPRINAAGRMASPTLAVELLLEENAEKAQELAEQLNRINAERKACEADIIREIEAQLETHPEWLHERVLVFAGENWHQGTIGIVASRMQERFGKPCFIISVKDGIGHGSARSFGTFHVFKALTACAERMEKFGGHPSAGGFTLAEEQIPAFRQDLYAYAAEQHPDMPFMEIQVACPLEPAVMTPEAVDSLQQLAPFGADHPEPVFLAEHAFVEELKPTANGHHTRMTVVIQRQHYTAMLFGKTPEETGIVAGRAYHMLVQLKSNTYRGRVSVTLYVQEVRPVGVNQMKILHAEQIYDKYCRGEELPAAYYPAMCPTRQEFVCIYQEIAKRPVTKEALSSIMAERKINHCKLLLALDVFAEMQLISLHPATELVELLPTQKKICLEDSGILTELKKHL